MNIASCKWEHILTQTKGDGSEQIKMSMFVSQLPSFHLGSPEWALHVEWVRGDHTVTETFQYHELPWLYQVVGLISHYFEYSPNRNPEVFIQKINFFSDFTFEYYGVDFTE